MGTHGKKKSAFKTTLKFFLKIVLAGGIIAWLIGSNRADFMAAVKNYNFIWLAPACALYLLHLVVGSWRWWLLMRVQNINITFFESFSLIMKGYFFSLVIPGGTLGGDLARLGIVASKSPSGSRLVAMFTILLDRFIGMLALFGITLVALPFSLGLLKKVEGVMEVAIYALILGIVAGLFSGIAMFFHKKLELIRPVRRLIRFFDKHTGNAYTKLAGALDSYRNSYWLILESILISVLFIHLNMAAILWCIGMGTGEKNLHTSTIITSVMIGNTAGLVPITPSGVGTRDSVVKTLLMAGGVSPGNASVMPIIYTMIILAFNVLGGIFFIFHSHKQSMFEIVEEEEEEDLKRLKIDLEETSRLNT